MRNQLTTVLTTAVLGLGGLVTAVPASATTAESTATTSPAVLPATALQNAHISEYCRSGNIWTITVKYTATFKSAELDRNYEWQATVRLWDDDPSSSDLIATKTRTIRPTSTSVTFTETFSLTRAQLNKDNGNEEIFAGIRLKNVTVDGREYKMTTPNVSISA